MMPQLGEHILDWLVIATEGKGSIHREQALKPHGCFPMFAGVRDQVYRLCEKARRAQLRNPSLEPMTLPRLPVLRRLKSYDTPPKTLGQFVACYQAKLLLPLERDPFNPPFIPSEGLFDEHAYASC